jgi:hypothetical protein
MLNAHVTLYFGVIDRWKKVVLTRNLRSQMAAKRVESVQSGSEKKDNRVAGKGENGCDEQRLSSLSGIPATPSHALRGLGSEGNQGQGHKEEHDPKQHHPISLTLQLCHCSFA